MVTLVPVLFAVAVLALCVAFLIGTIHMVIEDRRYAQRREASDAEMEAIRALRLKIIEDSVERRALVFRLMQERVDGWPRSGPEAKA